MQLSKKSIVLFHKKIFSWWEKNRRDLLWRHTHDPYKIFVSEVMLQQTQVFRVIPVYKAFLDAFPTVGDLAKAKTADVLRVWKGMGYNRRAVYLKNAAIKVVTKYHGKFPSDEKQLRSLSGVGLYTARAIQVFAFKKDVSMVDTNIRNIITHFFFQDVPQKEEVILDIAQQLVPRRKSWAWHQALMDYGALVVAKDKTIKKNRKKSALPFKLSDRYFRGRILDDLRVRERSLRTIKALYHTKYSLTSTKIVALLDRLKKDGLIEISSGGKIYLPQ